MATEYESALFLAGWRFRSQNNFSRVRTREPARRLSVKSDFNRERMLFPRFVDHLQMMNTLTQKIQ